MTPKECRDKMEKDMPMKGVPQAAKDLVWSLAWEHGHSSGMHEVAWFYEDFRDIALLAAGIKEE